MAMAEMMVMAGTQVETMATSAVMEEATVLGPVMKATVMVVTMEAARKAARALVAQAAAHLGEAPDRNWLRREIPSLAGWHPLAA